MLGRFAKLCAISACALLAVPAMAGRGTQVDVPFGGAACSLGSTNCTGVDVWASGIFSTAYIYREGIISFDGLLPVGATSNDLSSLGTGNYLAVGFSNTANYGTSAFRRIGTDQDYGYYGFEAYTFNFYNQDEPRYASDPDTGEIFYSSPFAPALQGQLFSLGRFLTADQLFSGVGLAAGYRPGAEPLPGAYVGFQLGGVQQMVMNSNGLLIGSAPGDTDVFTQTYFNAGHPPEPLYDDNGNLLLDDEGNVLFGPDVPPGWSEATKFTPLYGDATISSPVPEPAVWLTLLLGFGAVGGAMRSRKNEGRAITA